MIEKVKQWTKNEWKKSPSETKIINFIHMFNLSINYNMYMRWCDCCYLKQIVVMESHNFHYKQLSNCFTFFFIFPSYPFHSDDELIVLMVCLTSFMLYHKSQHLREKLFAKLLRKTIETHFHNFMSFENYHFNCENPFWIETIFQRQIIYLHISNIFLKLNKTATFCFNNSILRCMNSISM